MATTSTKPALSALKTPLSATYPSELRSPMVSTPTHIKREEGQQTPITPPAAYLDFLKTLSPVLMSPLATGTSSKFNFGDSRTSSAASVASITSTTSTASSASSIMSTSGAVPADKPSPTSSNHSSRASSCCNCDHPKSPPTTISSPPSAKSEMNITIPPRSPFVRPMSARTPRLFIPQSPYSPANVRTPLSAHSVHSPYSATMSPRSWDLEKKSSTTRRVSVREVVTRTVTYTSTPVDATASAFPPLDPAPKGKRRKIE
ncbi:hypothetical protein K432DRAFT_290040 [Lepidopterella palustris CBS 459.81]|uniref:Uncharacterized protein n=1 Tax=Lepidopterella palustris CBS 459.81 TaxID=1314670 RepID=A0A8E2EHY7_9PEZI|nr:hypothetical protein K432DRAFT_290040 [Lepidopterella palustris CBS 459.81]